MENENNEIKTLYSLTNAVYTIAQCDLKSVSVESCECGTVYVEGAGEYRYDEKSGIKDVAPDCKITHIIQSIPGQPPKQCTIVSFGGYNYVVCTTVYPNHTVDECPLVEIVSNGLSALMDCITKILFGIDEQCMNLKAMVFDARDFHTNDNFKNITEDVLDAAEIRAGITRTDAIVARSIALNYVRDIWIMPTETHERLQDEVDNQLADEGPTT